MSDSPSNGDDLLTFIAATIESMRDQMATKSDLGGMTTKADLEGLATKADLAGLATKADLAGLATKADLAGLATKSDLATLRDQVEYTGGQVEMMRDQMATKSDIARLEAKIEVETTVVRGDIEQVQLRLDAIERALTARLGQIETEVSRLRSVVYLLVKDKPEMLRLLGQTPPVGGAGQP